MKNIVLLFVTPPIEGDRKKFCLDKLMAESVNVEIWNITMLVHPELESIVKAKRLFDKRIRIIHFTQAKDFEECLRAHRGSSFFLPIFDLYYETRKIYRLFRKYNISYGSVNFMDSDIAYDSENRKRRFDWNSLLHINRVLFNRVIRKYGKFQNTKFVAVPSHKRLESIRNLRIVSPTTKFVYTHTFDYENFVSIRCEEKRNYAVFLDQFLPHHPDTITQLKINIDDKAYYEEMNDILKSVREKWGLDIVIAAHPRANYQSGAIFDTSFEIKTGVTAELVKNASLVLGHFSNSLSYCAMARVPLAIVCNPSIKSFNVITEYCKRYSELLGAPIIESSKDIQRVISFNVDKKAYDKFVCGYVAYDINDTEEVWKVILEAIDSLEN